MKFITAFLSMVAGALFNNRNFSNKRGGTPSKNKGLRNRDGLPSHTPGSKLARKALAGTLTMRRGRNY